jgi:hypothetical protein
VGKMRRTPGAKRRFRSKAEADMVRELTGRGWKAVGRNGTNHSRMLWPPTGAVLALPGKGDETLLARVRKTAAVMMNASGSLR